MTHIDADFAHHRKNAIEGSAKLRDAILRSLGHPVPSPRKRILKAPVFPVQPPAKRGRPLGRNKTDWKERELRTLRVATCRSLHVRLGYFVKGDSRRKFSRARHIAMYIAKVGIGASYPEIGRAFKRDHTTVLYAVREVQKRLDAGDQDTIRALLAVKRRMEK